MLEVVVVFLQSVLRQAEVALAKSRESCYNL